MVTYIKREAHAKKLNGLSCHGFCYITPRIGAEVFGEL